MFYCVRCRAGLASAEARGCSHTHLDDVRVFPGDAVLEYQWGKAPPGTVKRHYTTDHHMVLITREISQILLGSQEHEGATPL